MLNKRVRIDIPCGKCAACLKNKQNDWISRLRIELKYAVTAYFVTLTYDNENLVYADDIPILYKLDIQLFMKRLRKRISLKSDQKITYFLVGEYGEQTQRPHYHAIIYNIPFDQKEAENLLLKSWQKGHVHIGTVTPASISYTVKYIVQRSKMKNYEFKPFSLMSKGIGKQYIERMSNYHKKDSSRNYMIFDDGQKSRLPRYYREKLYSKHVRSIQNVKALKESRLQELKEKKNFERNNKLKSYFEHKIEQHQQVEIKVNKIRKLNSKI